MSLNRYARRADTTQQAIVDALRADGCLVYVIGKPCDLLVRYWSKTLRQYLWLPMECKTPYGKKDPKARLDKRQTEQIEFLQTTGIPIVLTPEQARKAIAV